MCKADRGNKKIKGIGARLLRGAQLDERSPKQGNLGQILGKKIAMRTVKPWNKGPQAVESASLGLFQTGLAELV